MVDPLVYGLSVLFVACILCTVFVLGFLFGFGAGAHLNKDSDE